MAEVFASENYYLHHMMRIFGVNPATVSQYDGLARFNLADGNGTIYGDADHPFTTTTSFNDSASLDAFGRLRVSQQHTLFDSQFSHSTLPLFWESSTTAGGSATHDPYQSTMVLRVDGTNAASVIRQTKRYFTYQPGKSQLILMTFVLGAATADVRKRIGYFDVSNGMFLEQDGSGVGFVRRSKLSVAAATDTLVVQADWNIDRMDGTGKSGINLDFTKAQILLIDMEWLGVGRARIGFVVNGIVYYAHEFLHANVMSTVYMTTATLPLRYEITRTAIGAGNTDLLQICSTVSSEGGIQEKNLTFGYAMVAGRTVSTSPYPILSIRVNPTSLASDINRETVIPIGLSVFTTDQPVAYWLVYNGTLTNPSWVALDATNSGVDYDISATAIANGTQIGGGGFVATSNSSRAAIQSSIDGVLYLTNNVAGDTGDTLSVVCQRVGASNATTFAALEWKEIY
jgi:hypothetical protein